MTIGRLYRVPLRDVWKHEAANFTTWLQDHLDVLSEALDIELNSAEREQPVGDFSVDLVAQDDQGRTVVIENQLEPTDHRHLGQLLTYLSTLVVEVAVWVVSRARPEHVNAINWLNQQTSCVFYLVQVEAFRIDDSAPAALFTLIVGPSEGLREAGQTRRARTEHEAARARFWDGLLAVARERLDLHVEQPSGHYHRLESPGSVQGLRYVYVITRDSARVELVIHGQQSERNRAVFAALRRESAEIEAAFGGPLAWLQGGHTCRLRHDIALGGLDDEDRWPELIEAMVGAMERLYHAIEPRVAALPGDGA